MGARRKVDMAMSPEPASQSVPAAMSMISAPSRIRSAYFAARAREGAPAGHLDWVWTRYNHDLSAYHNVNLGVVAGTAVAERDARIAFLLQETEATFTRWRDMPAGELRREATRVNSPVQAGMQAPSASDQVKLAMGQAEAAGVTFELLQDAFRAYPAAKLEQRHRAVLTTHRDLVMAELKRRMDAWSPEGGTQ